MRTVPQDALVRLLLLSSLAVAGCGDEGSSLKCGEGTVQDGDHCVVATDLTRPRLTSVALTELVVEEDGKRPLYVTHPSNVKTSFLIDGEPFSSMIVVGVESKDGSKACVLGSLPVEMGPRDAAEAPAPRVVTASGELYVQPDCAALAGEAEAVAWVSFDPFEDTLINGRPAVQVKDGASMAEFFRQTRLPLDGCKAGEGSAHPDSCVTAMEVKASPGMDVRLLSIKADSSVAVVPVLEMPSSAGAPPPDPADLPSGEPVTAGQDTPEALGVKLPEYPHLIVTTGLSIAGVEGEVEGDQVELSFALRPDPASLPQDQAEALSAWLPLTVQKQTGQEPDGKSVGSGKPPELEKLQADFLSQLVSASTTQKDSPVRIEGDALLMVRALGDQMKRYELRVCAVPKFDQAGPAPDATANDCIVQPVIVVLDHQKVREGDVPTSAPGASTRTLFSSNKEIRAGDEDTLEGTLYANTNNLCTDYNCSSESNVGAKLSGWFKGSIFKGYAYGNVAYGGTAPNGLKLSFDVFGVNLATKEWNLANGIQIQAQMPLFSVSQTFPIAKVCCPVGCLGFDATITGAAGIQAGGMAREINFAKECADGVMDSKGRCYVAYPTKLTQSQAKNDCKKRNGHLSEIANEEEQNAALAAITKAQLNTAWLGGYRAEKDCSVYDQMIADAKATFPASVVDQVIAMFTQQQNQCLDENKTRTQFEWIANGNMTLGYQHWLEGRPRTDGKYAPGLAMDRGSGGYWIDLNDASALGYVCEYQKIFELSANAGPFASIEVEGRASVDVGIGKLGAYVDTTLIKGSVPNTVGVRLSVEQPDPFKMRTVLFYDIRAEFSGLDGSAGLFYDAYIDSGKWRLVKWDGIEYGSWTLFGIDKTYMVQ